MKFPKILFKNILKIQTGDALENAPATHNKMQYGRLGFFD